MKFETLEPKDMKKKSTLFTTKCQGKNSFKIWLTLKCFDFLRLTIQGVSLKKPSKLLRITKILKKFPKIFKKKSKKAIVNPCALGLDKSVQKSIKPLFTHI